MNHSAISLHRKLTNAATPALLSLVAATVSLFFSTPNARAEDLPKSDLQFMGAAAQGGMTEVKLGELAGQNGTREDVKSFAQQMVKDHTAINNDLKALAAKKGVNLPESLDADHLSEVNKLSTLTGTEFDNAYISAMVKAHHNDLKAFKIESSDTKDPDIKQFVDKSIPVIQEHLKHIELMKK